MVSWFRAQAKSRTQDLLGARALPSLHARECLRARTQKIARELVLALLLLECQRRAVLTSLTLSTLTSLTLSTLHPLPSLR